MFLPAWAVSLAVVSLAVLSLLVPPTLTVKPENFKKCNQSGFCKRNRALADKANELGSSWVSPYRLSPKSITFQNGRLEAVILKDVGKKSGAKSNGRDAASTVRLPLTLTFLKSGVVRVTLDEEKRRKGEINLRHNSQARKERYDEAASWAIVGGLDLNSDAIRNDEKGVTRVLYGGRHDTQHSSEVVIRHQPFGIEFRRDGETQIRFNEKGYLNLEHWRPKVEQEGSDGESGSGSNEDDQSTWWEETFGGNTDSKPRGPESVGLDITFPGYEHVFGIPEHTGPLSLKETRGGDGKYSEPYRLYNSDVFEYELDSPMTLYGAIPFMQAHRKGSTVGVFWLNGAETWVDIVKSKVASNPLGIGGTTETRTHWFSESGLLDVFVFLTQTPEELVSTYSELTGNTQLPPLFSIAYHQCRWNYITDEDVLDVDRRFDKHQIPYDNIWLDIEYTDDRKYFTWDPLTFRDPEGMQRQLALRQRNLVAIIDPHIKNVADYHVADELKNQGLAIRNKDGDIYEGWCWPGSSHWVDCFNPAAIKWWMSLFAYDRFKGSTPNLFLWNDMNEPSVFNGPETTSPKDNLHHGNWEHRDLHNINGMTLINATYHGLLARDGSAPRRPFVLTRSFFAGGQRTGAMWTGDNLANWEHLAASIPMILSMGVSGYPWAGADVGGFFGDPSSELLTRWYQAGAFYPFFRAHAHIDARRREPYLADERHRAIITRAIRLRYQLLPAWYTAFHDASTDGIPILRPQYHVFPHDERGFAIDDQFYVGGTGLLAKPVTREGGSHVEIYLADSARYYDYFDFSEHHGPGRVTVPAPLDTIPLLMQAGHIVPRRDRPRRSSALMAHDPFTLVVVLDAGGHADGSLYLDDGRSFDYQNGAYIHRWFGASTDSRDGDPATLRIRSDEYDAEARTPGPTTAAYLTSIQDLRVERIIVVPAPSSWARFGTPEVQVVEEGEAAARQVELSFHPAVGKQAAWAEIRDPGVRIARSWEISILPAAK
ncbi:MAG: hypothetical protein M1826_002777 [Phylliscum demangeonii]|nr:MAG: hypothetical protein M1826_002777 [Phylliscum demangeonii]